MAVLRQFAFVPKYIAYADDVILYIANPEHSIPPLLTHLKILGTLSEFTITWEESRLMPLTPYSIDKQFFEVHASQIGTIHLNI